MPILYLTPSSIGYLAQSILALVITAYLAHLARQAWQRGQPYLQTLLLAVAFGMMTCLILFLFLDGALRSDFRYPALFLQSVALDLCLAALLQFAYRFPAPSPRQKWERRLTLLLSLLYVAWEISDTRIRFVDLAEGRTSVRPSDADYPLAVGFTWLVLLFVRQTVRFSAEGRGALSAFWRPSGPEARAARGYVFVAFGAMLLSVVEVFYAKTPMSVPMRELIYSLGMLVILFSFALVYINYLPQATTFMVKLVGMALVTILAALGTAGWLSSAVQMKIACQECAVPEGQTLRFTPNSSGGYDVAQAPYRFEADLGGKIPVPDNGEYALALPFSFPFYGQTWRAAYVSSDGFISFGDFPHRFDSRLYYTPIPAIFALYVDLVPEWAESGDGQNDGGVFVRPARDQVTISWYRLPFYLAPEHLLTFQLMLYSDGAYEITHARIPEQAHSLYNTRYTAWVAGATSGTLASTPHWLRSTAELPFRSPDDSAVVLDYYLCFRDRLHQQLAPLAALILGSSVLILIGFPFFFQLSLVRPLNTLLEGIRQVDAGNLKVAMPVQYHDEIGLITESFNKMTAQLGALLTHLEARVVERTRQLEAAKLEAEAANQAKSAFIENINHELRTPLASILVYTETLLDGAPGTLTEIQRDFLQTSFDNAQLLSRLIGDLLDASQTARKKLALTLENVDLPPLLASAIQLVQPLAAEKGIHLTLDLGPAGNDTGETDLFIEADAGRLKQIIGNLLTNAIKFTPSGGRVALALVATLAGELLNGRPLPDAGVHLQIQDSGAGIPPEDLPHIFERFYRGSNAADAGVHGAGLGLYLAQELVTAHHGMIWAENRAGALFHVWLPLRQPTQEISR